MISARRRRSTILSAMSPAEVIALFGPTGVGKTEVAIALAGRLRERGERPVAVSADALQVYAGLELLTGAAGAAERAALVAHMALTRMTPATIVAAKTLGAECERIAKVGYSCDREEFIAGLIAVAVPVRDAAGSVRAAIAVHAPVARMTLRQALTQLGPLREAAKKMEKLL